MTSISIDFLRQHLIDPEVCIRCNTCEETCPNEAISHDDNNYVVDGQQCNGCMECIAPCPTGAIDNWREVDTYYTTDAQFSWSVLPEQTALCKPEVQNLPEGQSPEKSPTSVSAPPQIAKKISAPRSASVPVVNRFNRAAPAVATVIKNTRLTDDSEGSDIHQIELDFGDIPFDILEGQSLGIIPPGADQAGKPHPVRQYSLASSREGEVTGRRVFALTVKRVPKGFCSNYLCDLPVDSTVSVSGPFGATFLMPNAENTNVFMVCTGTGVAPFRGFIERWRRTERAAGGQRLLFFGAQRPESLPYLDYLSDVPPELVTHHLCYSRAIDAQKMYVQDRIAKERDLVLKLLRDDSTHFYMCGVKGMEAGVESTLHAVSTDAGIDWPTLREKMRASGRYHVETY